MPRILKFDLQSRRLSEQGAFPDESTLLWSSRPYPTFYAEDIVLGHSFVSARMFGPLFPMEQMDMAHSLFSADLRAVLQTYIINESADFTHWLTSADLRTVLKLYGAWPAEPMDFSHYMVSGDLKVVLITYANWPAESMDMAHSFVSGALS